MLGPTLPTIVNPSVGLYRQEPLWEIVNVCPCANATRYRLKQKAALVGPRTHHTACRSWCCFRLLRPGSRELHRKLYRSRCTVQTLGRTILSGNTSDDADCFLEGKRRVLDHPRDCATLRDPYGRARNKSPGNPICRGRVYHQPLTEILCRQVESFKFHITFSERGSKQW